MAEERNHGVFPLNGASDAKRWDQIGEVFTKVMELPIEEREGFLDRECAGDPGLKAEVQALLDSADSSEEYFLGLAVRAGVPTSPPERLGRLAGKRLGRWRLVELIGRGGMGAVYLAERDDDQFTMQAALKILPLGVSSEDHRRRFLAERQILARLDHPNIARILDGGVTEDGTPFYVMERVQGVPIDVYCDENRLRIDERLVLFEEVCEAVQHAHRNLIVHQDLKPSNILVTNDGHVKLLDFGIARMLEPDEGEEQDATQVHGRAMTLPYASPEQVRGDPVTTASDIYSLGLVLYELLSGRHPYRHRLVSSLSAPSVIMDTVPLPPSDICTVSDSALAGGDPQWAPEGTIAEARSSNSSRLKRALAGDLDTIILMAIRKEPDRRYASVSGLSEDLRNHRMRLPVSARPATLGYRVSSFVQRNRIATSVGALALLLALILVFVSVNSAVRERAQGRAIQMEATTAEAVTGFLVGLFEFTSTPDGFADTIRARTLLDRGASRIAEALDDQPAIKSRILGTLSEVYGNLGLKDEEIRLLEEVVQIRRDYFPEDGLELARFVVTLAGAHRENRSFDLADPYYREALNLQRELQDHPSRLAATLSGFASNLANLEKVDSALLLIAEATILAREAHGPSAMATLQTDIQRAAIYRAANHPDSAAAVYQKVLPVLREKGDSARSLYSVALNNLGYFLKTQGDLAGAEAMYREALPLEREMNLPVRLLTLLSNIASVESDQGNQDEVEVALTERIGVANNAWPEGHWRVGLAYGALADFYLRIDQPDQALPFAEDQLESFAATLGENHRWTARAGAVVGVSLLGQDRFREAEPYLLKSHATFSEIAGPDDHETQGVVRRLADLYKRWGRSVEAERFRGLILDGSDGTEPGG